MHTTPVLCVLYAWHADTWAALAKCLQHFASMPTTRTALLEVRVLLRTDACTAAHMRAFSTDTHTHIHIRTHTYTANTRARLLAVDRAACCLQQTVCWVCAFACYCLFAGRCGPQARAGPALLVYTKQSDRSDARCVPRLARSDGTAFRKYVACSAPSTHTPCKFAAGCLMAFRQNTAL